MRNLKKILALVLALVMSLSLMATASAAETTSAGAANYTTAKEVLTGLSVFKGDYGTNDYRFDDYITRAETAALVYRIATSDVQDTQAGLYTNHPFTDLASVQAWATGYIAYGYNAEIIKGNGDGTFSPGANVTGYQVLAMILRTMGYGRNGEFEGTEWEIQTAATAKREGLLNGITAADEARLGEDASRGLVAQILFNALLQPTARYSALNPYNYEKDADTLGKQKFNLEEVVGVVTGNEFADLKSGQVLAEGRTNLEVAEDDTRTLAISTEITDIGERHQAYITGSKVLAITKEGLNNVKETGDATDISTTSKFNAEAEMSAASDIEYYVNFDRSGYWTSDYRIEYELYLTGSDSEDFRASYKENNGGDFELTTDAAGNTYYVYSKVIPANREITDEDYSNIRYIFTWSNGKNDNDDKSTAAAYMGKVFVGTQTNKDISDEISFAMFVDTYLNDKEFNGSWNISYNGEWVKFVDNDLDGKADYAFKTTSWLDEVVETYTNKSGETVLEYNWFDDDNDPRATNGDYQVRYMDETPVLGDKVICSLIDNQILVEPAQDVTKTVKSYSWRDDVITCTDGETLGQSGIDNATDMMRYLATMDDNVEYVMYLDHFGYVRAYESPNGTTYALVTEAYARNNANGNLVQNWPMRVELTIKDADPAEYDLVGGNGNLFVSDYAWAQIRNYSSYGNYYNWLQPATSHMGVTTPAFAPVSGVPTFGNEAWYFWDRSEQIVRAIDALIANDTFDYGTVYDVNGNVLSNHTASFTNVAVVNVDGENATLKGAAQLKLDQYGNPVYYANSNRARYAVDYIQLDTDLPVASGTVRYPIDSNSKANYVPDNNYYVNAVRDTEYYIVYDGGVEYFTSFENLPKLDESKVGSIHAAYAVAKDISSDNDGQPYWVADVIVFEVDHWGYEEDSIALAYYTPSRTNGTVQQLSTLNASHGPVELVPGGKNWSADLGQWGNNPSWGLNNVYGFYKLYNETEPVEGTMTASSIARIYNDDPSDGNYNANNIYAGIITREAYLSGSSYYIDVDMGWEAWMGARSGNSDSVVSIEIGTADTGKIYSITTDSTHQGYWYGYNEATALRYKSTNSSQVKAGDRVIWVNKGAVKTDRTLNTTMFVVDLGNPLTNATIWGSTASFLASSYGAESDEVYTNPNPAAGEWYEIMMEQGYVPGTNVPTDPDVETATAVVNGALNAAKDTLNAIINDAASSEAAKKAAQTALAKLEAEYTEDAVKELLNSAGTQEALNAIVADITSAIDKIVEEGKTDPDTPVPGELTVYVQYTIEGEEAETEKLTEGTDYEIVGNTIKVDVDVIELDLLGDNSVWTVTEDGFTSEKDGDNYVYVLTFVGGVPEEGTIVIKVDVAEKAAVEPGPGDPTPGPGDGDDDSWEILSASSRSGRTLSGRAAGTIMIGKSIKTPAGKGPDKAIMTGTSKESGFTVLSINFVEEDGDQFTWYVTASIYSTFNVTELKVAFTRASSAVDPENPPAAEIPVTITGTVESVKVNGGEEINDFDTVNPGDTINVIPANENDIVKINNVERKTYVVDAADKVVKIEVTAGPEGPGTGDVKVEVTTDDGAASSLQIAGEDGEYGAEATLTAKDGKLTLTAKMVLSSSGDIKPVVTIDGKLVGFTKTETPNVWTLDVEVTEDTTLEVTAKEYFVVTLSKAYGADGYVGITFDGEEDNKVSEEVFKGEDISFTATMKRTDIQPKETTGTGAKISQDENGKWIISYENVTSKINATFDVTGNIYLTANVGLSRKMELVDETLAAGGEVLIKGGAYELVVDAAAGTQPVITDTNGTKYFVLADETYGTAASGMVRWVYAASGVNTSKDVTVSESTQAKATLTQTGSGITIPNAYTGASTSTAYVVKGNGEGDKVFWSAAFSNVGVYSSNMIELSNSDDGSLAATKTGTDASGRDLYDLTFTSAEMSSFNTPDYAGYKVNLKATAKKNVRLTDDSNGYIMVDGLKSSVAGAGEKATKTDGSSVTYAKFTLTVAEGYIPTTTEKNTAVRFAPVAGSATEWEAWVVPKESETLTEVEIGAKKIPQISVANSTNADIIDTSDVTRIVKMTPVVTPVETSKVDGWDWENGMCPITFEGEITGIKTTIATTVTAEIGGNDAAETANKITVKTTPEGEAKAFSIKLSVDSKSNLATDTITAELKANVGYRVTITVDSASAAKIDLGDLMTTQYVKAGGDISFKAELTNAASSSDSILSDKGVSTLNADGTYTITLGNVTEDTTIKLSVGTAKEFTWKIKNTTADGVANVPVPAGSGSNSASFTVQIAPGYKLTGIKMTNGGTEYNANTDYKVVDSEFNPKAGTDTYVVEFNILNSAITSVEIELTVAKDNNVNGWTFKPARIWNAYATGDNGAATGNRLEDTHDFSHLYKAGSYTVSGGELERDTDGNYTAEVTVNADDVIMHWNGTSEAEDSVKGWWTGLCITVPSGVYSVKGTKTYNGETTKVEQTAGTTVNLYEGSDGTAASDFGNDSRRIALYHNAKESGVVTYELGCYAENETEPLYTLTLTVHYNVTVAQSSEVPTIPEQEEATLSGWQFNLARIWNAYQVTTDETTGKVEIGTTRRPDDGQTFSKLYEKGTYNIYPGVFEYVEEDTYAITLTVTADQVIRHAGGNRQVGWWTGVNLTLPEGVTSVSKIPVNGGEGTALDTSEGKLIETASGTGEANKGKSIALYYSATKDSEITYRLECTKTNASRDTETGKYTILLTVQYKITSAADQTIPEVSNTNPSATNEAAIMVAALDEDYNGEYERD